MLYLVFRVFFNAETGVKSSSCESFDNKTAALKRYYTVVATDLDKTSISYEMVKCTRDDGVDIGCYIIDNRVQPEVEE